MRRREARLERAEVDPVWLSSSSLEREAAGARAERVAAMTGAEQEIEDLLLGRPVAERRDDLVGVAAVDRTRRGRSTASLHRPASGASASMSTSLSAPSPAAIAARRAMISNSDGDPGARSNTGGEKLATLRIERAVNARS